MKPNGDTSRFLLLCGALAPIMLMVIIIVVGQITPDYDPISDTISQMGTPESRYAIVLNGGYVIYGILMGLAAYGLYRSIGSASRAKGLAILLGIHALGALLLGVFPDTRDLVPKHFTDDLVHNTISAVSYVPLLVGILIFRGVARQNRALRVVGVVGLVVVAFNLPMPIISLFDPLKSISGLLQRLLCGSSFCWLAATFLLLCPKRHPLDASGILRQSGSSRKYPTRQSDFSDFETILPAQQ
jgi:hypothetical membrane protein